RSKPQTVIASCWRAAGPASPQPTWPWRSTPIASTSRCRWNVESTATSVSGLRGDALPIADGMLEAVVLLVAFPGLLVERPHVVADLVHHLVRQGRGAQPLGQRVDREVARLEHVDPHRFGDLADVVEGELLVRSDHHVHGRR